MQDIASEMLLRLETLHKVRGWNIFLHGFKCLLHLGMRGEGSQVMRKYRHRRRSNNHLARVARPSRKIWPALTHLILAPVFTLYVIFCLLNIAQTSTPDVPFYGLKLAIEDARLGLAIDQSQHASLALSFATERVSEIVQIANRSQVAPELVLLRLQNQLRAAMQDATSADEQDRQRLLAQVNDVTKQLQITLTQALPEAPIATQSALSEAERLAEQTRRQAEEAMNDSAPRQKGPGTSSVTPVPTLTQQAPP